MLGHGRDLPALDPADVGHAEAGIVKWIFREHLEVPSIMGEADDFDDRREKHRAVEGQRLRRDRPPDFFHQPGVPRRRQNDRRRKQSRRLHPGAIERDADRAVRHRNRRDSDPIDLPRVELQDRIAGGAGHQGQLFLTGHPGQQALHGGLLVGGKLKGSRGCDDRRKERGKKIYWRFHKFKLVCWLGGLGLSRLNRPGFRLEQIKSFCSWVRKSEFMARSRTRGGQRVQAAEPT